MKYRCISSFLVLLFYLVKQHASSETLCAYSVQKSKVKFPSQANSLSEGDEDDTFSNDVTNSTTTERCKESSHYCYTLWQEDPQSNDTVILAQGCWETPGEDCRIGSCVSTRKPAKPSNITKFCCCYGNLCNVNISDEYIPGSEDSSSSGPTDLYRDPPVYTNQTVFIGVIIFAVVILAVVFIFIFQCWSTNKKPSPDSVRLMEAPPPPSPTFDLDSLKIQETIGRGRYGSVCKGSLNDHTVAVKIFSQHNYHYYLNERDIYKLPHMDHLCLPKLIGSDERLGSDGRMEFLLVLTHAPLGCLQDYLRGNTVDWGTLCKMAQTVTKGLAYLHTEVKQGDKLKPCVAHRDLTSRNILVREDGSCMLCDFGFAIRITGSKYIQNGEEQHAETTSLADVGTLRYMAPEVLEGAVNLRDCESSLKQIDVYALGLILWEVATRCSDLYQGMTVPDFKMPFEKELGSHPSAEQMQVLVARHKARPLFPDIWKDSNLAVRVLKETIDDCWDQDAEARLTALCVEERLYELPVLWERHKAGISVPGVSPTINPTFGHHRGTSLLGGLTTSALNQPTINVDNSIKESSYSSNFRNSNNNTNAFNNNNRFERERINSMSDNTTETILSPSESTPPPVSIIQPISNTFKNAISNQVISVPAVSVPLQPHQGRNPCLERNLMKEPLEEVAISGNTLLEQGASRRNEVFSNDHGFDSDIFDSPHISDNLESNALVSNDVLTQSTRSYHPIPYVQNAVHVPSTIPKQPNVPGNGHHAFNDSNAASHKNKPEKKRGPFHGIFTKNKNKQKEADGGMKSGIKKLFDRKVNPNSSSQSAVNGHIKSHKDLMQSQGRDSDCITALLDAYGHEEQQKWPVNTEVQMVNGGCVVRPLVNPSPSILNCDQVDLIESRSCLQNGEVQSGGSVSSGVNKDINGNCKAKDLPFSVRVQRPTTLPLRTYLISSPDNSSINPVDADTLVQPNDVGKESKTDESVQKALGKEKTHDGRKERFSLYDDRIMSNDVDNSPLQEVRPETNCSVDNSTSAPKFSQSVPMDIASLCVQSQSDSVYVKDPRNKTDTVQQDCRTKK